MEEDSRPMITALRERNVIADKKFYWRRGIVIRVSKIHLLYLKILQEGKKNGIYKLFTLLM